MKKASHQSYKTETDAKSKPEEIKRFNTEESIYNFADDHDFCNIGYFHPLCVSFGVASFSRQSKISLLIHIRSETTKKYMSLK